MKNSEKMICNKLVSLSYFEAGRSPRKRSLLDVNEHFEGEPDAEIAKLDNLFYYLRIAATPGNSLPSIYSSSAPPPVDT